MLRYIKYDHNFFKHSGLSDLVGDLGDLDKFKVFMEQTLLIVLHLWYVGRASETSEPRERKRGG